MAKITEDIINEMIKEYGGEGVIEYDGEFRKERPYIWLKHIDGRREECRKTKEEISCKVRKLLNGVTLDAINRIIKENGGEGIVTYDGEYREGRLMYVWLRHADGRRESCQKRTESIKYKTRSLIRNIEITIDAINEIIKENGAKELIKYDGEFKEGKGFCIWLKCIDGRRESCRKTRPKIEDKIRKLMNEKPTTTRNGVDGKECSVCNTWKPLEEYGNLKRRKDGLSLICRDCKKEYYREYRFKNEEKLKIKQEKTYKEIKERFIENIVNTLEGLNPIFKQLNLKVYGYIYKITHTNGHCYIGQSIKPLNIRYRGEIIKGWIKERYIRDSQKFSNELKEEEFTVEIIDIAISKWHLDKLEVYYINKYNSHENGYNNNPGNYKTDDGLEEFKNILKEYNLEFVDNELRKINN